MAAHLQMPPWAGWDGRESERGGKGSRSRSIVLTRTSIDLTRLGLLNNARTRYLEKRHLNIQSKGEFCMKASLLNRGKSTKFCCLESNCFELGRTFSNCWRQFQIAAEPCMANWNCHALTKKKQQSRRCASECVGSKVNSELSSGGGGGGGATIL